MVVLQRWVAGLARVCVGIVVATMVTMTSVLVASIFTRYLFNAPIVWADDIALYAMVWLGMACAPLALVRGEHVALTFVYDAVPAPWQRLLRLVIHAYIVLVSVLVVWHSGSFVQSGFAQILPTLPMLSQGGMYVAIPIGFAATAFVSLVRILEVLTGREVDHGDADTIRIAG